MTFNLLCSALYQLSYFLIKYDASLKYSVALRTGMPATSVPSTLPPPPPAPRYAVSPSPNPSPENVSLIISMSLR